MSAPSTCALALRDNIDHASRLVAAAFALQSVEIDSDEVLNALRLHLRDMKEDAEHLHTLLSEEMP